MGRWTQYDEDEYRLPEGMKRVGYDAETQKYTFRDNDGVYYEGPAGAEYGELRKVGEEPRHSMDIEATAPIRQDGYIPLNIADVEGAGARNREAWRQLLPFMLIIVVCLLLVIRLISPAYLQAQPKLCPEDTRPVIIKAGDTCWAISKDYDTSLVILQRMNPSTNCDMLQPGERICVPVKI